MIKYLKGFKKKKKKYQLGMMMIPDLIQEPNVATS